MAKRKFESILELKERGLNIGEMDEFTYRQLDDALEYAKELIEKFGGFSLRTDFPPGDTRVRMALPVLKDPTLENLKEFIEENKDNLTYLIYQKRDYHNVIWQGRFILDDNKALTGEVNAKDKKLNIREALKQTSNLERIKCGPGGYDERFMQVRADMIKAKIEPYTYVSASAYDEDGKVVIYYKDMARDH
jgi:hypothetical protein